MRNWKQEQSWPQEILDEDPSDYWTLVSDKRPQGNQEMSYEWLEACAIYPFVCVSKCTAYTRGDCKQQSCRRTLITGARFGCFLQWSFTRYSPSQSRPAGQYPCCSPVWVALGTGFQFHACNLRIDVARSCGRDAWSPSGLEKSSRKCMQDNWFRHLRLKQTWSCHVHHHWCIWKWFGTPTVLRHEISCRSRKRYNRFHSPIVMLWDRSQLRYVTHGYNRRPTSQTRSIAHPSK